MTIFFTFSLGKKLINVQVGLLSALAMAISPYMILYSTNARGYTIMVLLGLLLALQSLSYIEKQSIKHIFYISFIASLGMFTMPSMLFLISGIYFWIVTLLFINNKQSVKIIVFNFIIPITLITSIMTIGLYTPVILKSNGIDSIVSNRFVTSESWSVFISQIFPHFQHTFHAFNRDFPIGFIYLGTVFLFIGLFALSKEKKWKPLFLLPSLFFAAGVIFFLKHKIPFDRTWIYFLPFIFIIISTGLNYIIDKVLPKTQLLFYSIFILYSTYFVLFLLSNNAIMRYGDTGTFPKAPIVMKYLNNIIDQNDRIHVKLPADWPVKFYRWYFEKQKESSQNNGTIDEYYIVRKNKYTVLDITKESVTKIWVYDDIEIYKKIHRIRNE